MTTFDEKWEEVHRFRGWGKYPSEEVIRFVARNRPSTPSSTVKALDAGCGAGPVLWMLAREGIDAYGFDGSAAAIAAARMLLEEEKLTANTSVCDAGGLHFASEFFDLTIDNGMCTGNRVANISVILRELYRVTKPGGKFLSTKLFTDNTTGFGSGEKVEERTFRNLHFGPLANIGTIHFFREDEIRELWQRIGFGDLKIDRELRTINGGDEQVEFFVVESVKH